MVAAMDADARNALVPNNILVYNWDPVECGEENIGFLAVCNYNE